MIHNLHLGPEADASHALALLRAMEMDAPVEPGQHLVPGLFFSCDPDGEVRIQCRSRPDHLLDITLDVARPGRWLALHLALGPVDLTGRQAVGFICKSQSPVTTTFQPCLRSGREGEGFTDQFFRKSVLTFGHPGLHLDTILPETIPSMPVRAPWRELVFFFRPETSHIDLQDLRLFII